MTACKKSRLASSTNPGSARAYGLGVGEGAGVAVGVSVAAAGVAVGVLDEMAEIGSVVDAGAPDAGPDRVAAGVPAEQPAMSVAARHHATTLGVLVDLIWIGPPAPEDRIPLSLRVPDRRRKCPTARAR
jgi:hypothetical protein